MRTTLSVAEPAFITSRHQALRTALQERRRELVLEVRASIRAARADDTHEHHVGDQGDASGVSTQDDIGFALIQMKAEMLDKVNAALQRIDEDAYGACFECGDDIAEPRLRALPFAVRCKECEERREVAEQREGTSARWTRSSLFQEV